MSVEEKKKRKERLKRRARRTDSMVLLGKEEMARLEDENKVLKRDSAEYESRSLAARRNNL